MNGHPHDSTVTCCTADALSAPLRARIEAEAAELRAADPAFASWAAGYGAIVHDPLTQWRVHQMLEQLARRGTARYAELLTRLAAADRIASAGMWLVVHMTYARRVRTDGEALIADDFKLAPEGHTGGSLNMVPAYVAYLLVNALSGHTRAWLMGQGHCVAAIDAVNVLVGNMSEAHAARYDASDAGLTRLTNDFYSYRIRADGTPDSPLGSHVNAYTAGGLIEGGYLGFAELLYPHLPLPGERLVAFLSDGAFEEQRGSDWAPRWWRPEDCGFVAPVMILNGRRIEQRSSIAQEGGERWLDRHLRLNGFDPIGLDGRDPASIAWGIWEMEARLAAQAAARERPSGGPVRLGYGIAEVLKGYGFPGAGTNRAHNLPLPANPAYDADAREAFNQATRALRVPPAELQAAVAALQTHTRQQRPYERDNAVARRTVPNPVLPTPEWTPVDDGLRSPMDALDAYVLNIVHANPHLRVRVGNPDELRSNKFDRTLDALKHRVDHPESGVAESEVGAVITALNEESVICAALGNQGGINVVVTYEAFAVKMLGALRQTIIFARHQKQAGHPAGWLSIPLLLTSHTWENGKNEQSHQDPTLAEALLGEMADTTRVMFPVDANSAVALLRTIYRTHGQVAAMVVPKRPMPSLLSPERAEQLAERGMLVVEGVPDRAQLLLISCGAYQLAAALRARARMAPAGIEIAIVALAEPARLRTPRDGDESTVTLGDAELLAALPPHVPRVLITHTRPEPMLGALRRLDTGSATTRALGYRNHGGTLDVDGLLFANGCSWAHIVRTAADVLGHPLDALLSAAENAALDGAGVPSILR